MAEAAFMSAPIPGMSLTKPEGSAASERPPRFVELDAAAEFIWEKLQNPKTALPLMQAFEDGAPIEMMTKNILLEGYRNGDISFDLQLQLQSIVAHQMGALAKVYGVDAKPTFKDNELAKMMARAELAREAKRPEKDPFAEGTALEEVPSDSPPERREFAGILGEDPFAEGTALEELSDEELAAMDAQELEAVTVGKDFTEGPTEKQLAESLLEEGR